MFKCSKKLFSVAFSCIAITIFSSGHALAKNVDPTKPFDFSGFSTGDNSQSPEEGGLVLTSIIHGDGIHTVVINGKVYKMFDYVGKYRITGINDHSVIVRSETERIKLEIYNHKGFKSHVVDNTVAN